MKRPIETPIDSLNLKTHKGEVIRVRRFDKYLEITCGSMSAFGLLDDFEIVEDDATGNLFISHNKSAALVSNLDDAQLVMFADFVGLCSPVH